MPNRIQADNSYRFAYQGQFAEKDEETGFHSFELRQWDSRIARWMAPDPMKQYWSPYLGVGNNPFRIVDPTGGTGDDIIIKGANNSSYTIKAPGDDIIINLPFINFGGNIIAEFELDHVPDLDRIAIGYEASGEAGITGYLAADFSVKSGAVMFLGGDYKLYWYPYAGGDARGGPGVDFGASASLGVELYIGYRTGENDHPLWEGLGYTP